MHRMWFLQLGKSTSLRMRYLFMGGAPGGETSLHPKFPSRHSQTLNSLPKKGVPAMNMSTMNVMNLDGLGNMTNTPATASRGSTLAVQAANSSMMMQLSRVKKRRKMGTSRQGHTFWPVGASAREHARAGFEGSPFWVLRKACPSSRSLHSTQKFSRLGLFSGYKVERTLIPNMEKANAIVMQGKTNDKCHCKSC